MSSTQTLDQGHREAIEAVVSQALEHQDRVASAHDDYINCAVSASLSVGPEGAGMQGWITYTESGRKIYFRLQGEPSTYHGLFAGGGAFALIGALRPERLSGKTGTFTATGWFGEGAMALHVDGRPVLTMAIPLVGVGAFHWKVEGKVSFEERS
ncbi:MAG: hypothetical protein MI919_15835 [Holophagales bacterium]|nr:hypothetical protein [Holophagales bacterium]